MTEIQLKSLVGCILKYKAYDFCIKEINKNTIKLNNNNITLYYNKDILNGYYPTVSRTLMINETEDIKKQ